LKVAVGRSSRGHDPDIGLLFSENGVIEWDNGKKFGDTIFLWQRKDLPHRVGDPRRASEKKHSFTSPIMNANSSIRLPKSNAEV
jgi:hypothetical protein